MKIAIPVAEDKLCLHFGHCEKFALIDVDEKANKIQSENYVDAPPHQPGLLPKWLNELGADCIIAGVMGSRAKEIFESYNIKVIIGVNPDSPKQIVHNFLNNELRVGDNVCDH